MSLSSDNFTALIHLRNQARKWKNVTFIISAIALLLFSRMMFKTEKVVGDNIGIGKDYIANILVEGMIFSDDYRDKILGKLAKQKNIKAVIVNINSPGGGIVGSEILYENLRKIAENKPIVVVMGSLAASGGYMIAIASDHIIARNGTLTGSIGVIMQSSEITDLADKIGIKFLTYKSSKLKGSPSPFEKSSPQVDKVIKASIKDSYEFFTGLVLERRKGKINKKHLSNIIDGRVFTGRQALKSGLIDEIGGKDQALQYLKTTHKINIDKIEVKDVLIIESENQFIQKFFGQSSLAQYLGFNPYRQGLISVLN